MSAPEGPAPVPLFTEAEIATRIEVLAGEMDRAEGWRARSCRPILVCLLRGALPFTADLLRALARAGVAAELDTLHLSSYGGGRQAQGPVEMVSDLTVDLSGREVVLVDDVLDSGRSLAFALDHVRARGAFRVRSCVLLDKGKAGTVRADYVAFACPDRFVVGYGMDLGGAFRGLPYVGALD